MLKKIVAAIALTTLAAGCASLKVYVDYDRDADLKSYKTFSWIPTEETSLKAMAPVLHDRLVAAVENKLEEGGIRRIKDGDPDLFVTYHAATRDDYRYSTASYGYGYGGGWYPNSYWGAPSGTTTTVTTFQKGTLVIDIWDARTTNMVWRGTAEKVVSDDLRKAEDSIFEAVDKMVAEFDRMRKENG